MRLSKNSRCENARARLDLPGGDPRRDPPALPVTAGIVHQPRPADFASFAEYVRAHAAWLAGWRWQRSILRELHRQRRACGPCEL